VVDTVNGQAVTNDGALRRSIDSILGPTLVFAGVAAAFASMFVAAGAPTPLLVRIQQSWGFPVSLLTIAFAAYAVGFVGALLLLSVAVTGLLAQSKHQRPSGIEPNR
jgi:hypothetical protein